MCLDFEVALSCPPISGNVHFKMSDIKAIHWSKEGMSWQLILSDLKFYLKNGIHMVIFSFGTYIILWT